MHPLDIWRAAKLLAERHGEAAPGEARVRAMSLRQQGDKQGTAVWQRLLAALLRDMAA